MKIGIHLGNGVPESGGASTFQESIVEALFEVAPRSQHTFVLFHGKKARMSCTQNVTSVQLYLPKYVRGLYRFCRSVGYFAKILNCQPFLIPQYSGEARRIEQSGVDIVWYAGPFCSTMEIPYIINVFDLQHRLRPYFPEVSSNGIWENREHFYSVKLRRATNIIVGTEVGKKEIEMLYQILPERIKVLPYAYPDYNLSRKNIYSEINIRKKYNIPNNYLFYPAQYWPHKNHIALLQAVRILIDKWNISIPVVFVGSDKGNLNYIKKNVIKLGLSDMVYFLGFVPREDLFSLYKNAIALVMPTLFGPDNLPPLEAFVSSCPVIISDLNGISEQLGDAALFVNPLDTNQIALSIKSIYEEPNLRKKLIQRALNKATMWTWEDYIESIIRIIEDFEPIRECWQKRA